MNNIKKITACRMCGNKTLVRVVDLGEQYLTGVFPDYIMKDELTCGSLCLVKCHGGDDVCGLLQLEHSYDLDEMYGYNYGYRSGLNTHMVKHLGSKVDVILKQSDLKNGDLVIDIGSNDGTTLGFYPEDLLLVGIDPSGAKFSHHYKPNIKLIADFFSKELLNDQYPDKKANVVTSFSMLYDLERPLDFVNDIASILDPDSGLWFFEQSYMPLMLEKVAFDTICHEHIEYYGLKQIMWLVEQAGMKIIDIELNDINGGSFSVIASLKSALHKQNDEAIQRLLNNESDLNLDELEPYQQFSKNIDKACSELKEFIKNARSDNKRVCGLGASTKGNVLLQYCGLTSDDVEAIGEVNTDKYGALTPGSWINIKAESEVLASKPDYLIVLPWHFKEFFLNNDLFKGHTLVFPLPSLEIVKV